MRRAAVAIAALALIAALVVGSGAISITASSGHLAVTAWVLDFAKRRSVHTRSLTIETPPLDDAALVALGAAHYDRGCRPCHGSPGGGLPLIPSRMTPHPPDLPQQVGRWQPRELFYIVAHGIKFTGMPAWPSPDRTDEVWPVVAFLRRLPGMDAATYARLVTPQSGASSDAGTSVRTSTSASASTPPPTATTPDVEATAERCAVCHRPPAAGSRLSLVPVLSGQRRAYLRGALEAYASGARKSGIMEAVASALDPEQRDAIAERVSLAPDGPDGPDDAGNASAGSGAPALGDLLLLGDPGRDVPACAQCHGPSDDQGDPHFPRLSGQPEAYLKLQLQLFAENRRGGSPYSAIMRAIAVRLTPGQIEEAARRYAALPGTQP